MKEVREEGFHLGIFTSDNTNHHCGSTFVPFPDGISHGGRQLCLGNIAMSKNRIFGMFAPKLFYDHVTYLQPLFNHDLNLRLNFTNSILLAITFNLGPYAHLYLKQLKLVVEFPPMATAAIPSAIIKHGNTPLAPDKTRYSITQYAAGRLFHWVNYRFCTVKELLKQKGRQALKATYDGALGERHAGGRNLFSKRSFKNFVMQGSAMKRSDLNCPTIVQGYLNSRWTRGARQASRGGAQEGGKRRIDQVGSKMYANLDLDLTPVSDMDWEKICVSTSPNRLPFSLDPAVLPKLPKDRHVFVNQVADKIHVFCPSATLEKESEQLAEQILESFKAGKGDLFDPLDGAPVMVGSRGAGWDPDNWSEGIKVRSGSLQVGSGTARQVGKYWANGKGGHNTTEVQGERILLGTQGERGSERSQGVGLWTVLLREAKQHLLTN
ncbi:hypothetical protein B0H16DRAFT_1479213 [Mycena metata]|uniref:Uncharacterized protein n=1 Tax=Mycena metata TaxID=1033252 RepID=A0AAD7MDP8_9AGAR|nr:hypothetical protein B0H16DRAFT_1479213 [Mycena metata]